MNHSDIDALAQGLVPVIQRYVGEALSPLTTRLDGLESRFAAMPTPRDGVSITVDDVSPFIIATIRDELKTVPEMVTAEVATAVSMIEPPKDGRDGVDGAPGEPGKDGFDGADGNPGKDGEPGKDADPDVVAGIVAERMAGELEKVHAILEAMPEPEELPDIPALVQEAIAALPKPQDGRTPAPEELRQLIEESVSAAFSALPVPKDGLNGKDADVEEIAARLIPEVERAVAAIPIPKDGRDGIDGKDGKDGIGLAGGVIDRKGELVLTLTDGKSQALGVIVGKDGEKGEPGQDGKDGRNGLDGVGFDDLDVKLSEDERTVVIEAARGENRKSWELRLPHVIDQGVFKDGETYVKGDAVSWGGSVWIARRDTIDKPETSDAWRLAVKRGRDGKDGKDGAKGDRGPEGKPGR